MVTAIDSIELTVLHPAAFVYPNVACMANESLYVTPRFTGNEAVNVTVPVCELPSVQSVICEPQTVS